MPKRGKEPRPSSRHSGGHFSPTPPTRQPRNDYQIAGPSRSMSDSSSGRRSPHSKDNTKNSNGNARLGNSSNRILNMNIVNSPIILTDDDDDDDYQNLDSSKNIFRENGNKLKPDPGESTRIVKHFVPSADRYQMSQCAPEKPVFRGPETDVLLELEQDKLKNIKIQMLRADVQNESFRKAYVVQEPVTNRSKGNESDWGNNRNQNPLEWITAGINTGEKNHQNFDDRQSHFNSTQQIHYDNGDKNYGMIHPISPSRLIMNRDRSLSPRMNMGRPPSPPPYSPERDHFNSDGGLRRDRQKRSPDRNIHDRPLKSEHFMEHVKMENFNSGHPPEPRSPEMQRFRSSDHHNRHRMKEELTHYDDRTKRSRSPIYYGNHYPYRNLSPNHRPYSPSRSHLPMPPMSPPTSRDLSPSLRDRPSHSNERPPHSNDRSRRRRTPPRRDRSRERRRRLSPRRRTPPPPNRSPVKRRENGKKRGSNKNQESRKRELKERKRRSQSKSKSSQPEQQQQQSSFQQPSQQAMYPPPPGVVRLPPPPRPYPPGPMLIPLRPPPFPPPMGAWRPARPPPMQAPPPSGWPYPRPRPFYFPY